MSRYPVCRTRSDNHMRASSSFPTLANCYCAFPVHVNVLFDVLLICVSIFFSDSFPASPC